MYFNNNLVSRVELSIPFSGMLHHFHYYHWVFIYHLSLILRGVESFLPHPTHPKQIREIQLIGTLCPSFWWIDTVFSPLPPHPTSTSTTLFHHRHTLNTFALPLQPIVGLCGFVWLVFVCGVYNHMHLYIIYFWEYWQQILPWDSRNTCPRL